MQAVCSKETQRKAVSAQFLAFGFGFSTWASGIPDIQHRLNLPDAELGLLLFAIPCGDLVTIPLSGWITARYGTKNLVMYFLVAYALVLSGLSLANSRYSLTILMFLFGATSNLSSLCINTQSVLIQKKYNRSILGSFHGLWSLAGFAGAALGTFVSWSGISTPWHFGIASVLIISLTVFSNPFYVEDEKKEPSKKHVAVPDRYLLLLGTTALACMFVEGTMFDWSGIYFRKISSPPEELQGVGYAAFMGCMALGRFVADKLTDYYGTSMTLQISSLLITAGLLTSVLIPHYTFVILGFALTGFGTAPVVPLVFGLAGKSGRFLPSTALTIVGSIGFLGFLFGPPLIGTIAGMFNLRISFLAVAFCGMVIGVLGRFGIKNNSKS